MTGRTNQRHRMLILGLVAALVVSLWPHHSAAAQQQPGDVVNCGPAINFSQSPEFSSVDPFMVADPAGTVHLFWAERISGGPNSITNTPDAVLYSAWNGESWSTPVDLFLSPRELFNKRINAIRGAIDEEGYIHLVWGGPDNWFFYATVHASQAGNVDAWHGPVLMSTDQSGAQYSIDVNVSSTDTVHILYGREPAEGANQLVSYIRSDDGGLTWTDPKTVYTVPYTDRGASNMRVWVNGENVYATWTEWDTSGNGQAIFFARSLDGGNTWQTPVRLAERQGIEYERDWTTLAVLGDDELVTFWEGGYRAYRQSQYSEDGGATWSAPKDTLDWLIADNGFAEFIRDGADRLHLFVFQRVREGNDDRNPFGGQGNGLWHSVYEGDRQWRQPQMVGDPNTGNFVTVAIRGGNELFAAWFSYIGLELSIIQCELYDTPAVPLIEWSDTVPVRVATMEEPASETAVSTPLTVTDTAVAGDNSGLSFSTTVTPVSSPGQSIFLGLLPAIFIMFVIFLAVGWRKRRHATR